MLLHFSCLRVWGSFPNLSCYSTESRVSFRQRPSLPQTLERDGSHASLRFLSRYFRNSRKLSSFQICEVCVQMSEIFSLNLRSSEEIIKRKQGKTCSWFVFKSKEVEKEHERWQGKECGGSKVVPGTRCPGRPSGLRLPSPSFQECWLWWDYSGLAPSPPSPHAGPLAGPSPFLSSQGRGVGWGLRCNCIAASAQSCHLHSPAGVVSRSSSQETCMWISSSESVSRPKTGRGAKSVVFLIGGQFLPHIEKTHKPMSIQPWITFSGFITHSLFGMARF